MNPFTALLDSIQWHFAECPSCQGLGCHRNHRTVECRKCRGTGYLRTSTHRSSPTRTGYRKAPR
jgi:DnaJ-class molecular chaperone